MANTTRNLYAAGFLEKFAGVYCDIHNRIYGYNYRLSLPKGFKEGGKKNFSRLLNFVRDNLCNLSSVDKHVDLYSILKDLIEENAYLLWHEEHIFKELGIERDFSEFNLTEKHTIKTQCIGQVFWWLHKGNIPTISAMVEKIILGNIDWQKEFDPKRFGKKKIRDSLSMIYPVHQSRRKGRPSKSSVFLRGFEKVIPIPGVYSRGELKVHFPKLRYVIQCITKVLQHLEWDRARISSSELIQFYTDPLLSRFTPIIHAFKEDWIYEALKK